MENSTLAIISPLLLINSIDATILWARLAKRSKEISCSRNLVAARDFYDTRQTFNISSYENLVEKSVRHASDLTPWPTHKNNSSPLCNFPFLFHRTTVLSYSRFSPVTEEWTLRVNLKLVKQDFLKTRCPSYCQLAYFPSSPLVRPHSAVGFSTSQMPFL